MAREVERDDLDVTPDHVLVLKNGGPKGGPGMPEWGQLPIPKKLLKAGVRDMLRISDARMSGTSYGACILHVAPESFVGGPLAFVQTGDEIEIDVAARQIHLHVSDEELARRRAAWTAAAAALSARLRRDVLRAYRPGRRGLRFRFSRRHATHRGAGDSLIAVMPGHSRSKNGVALLAYVPGIHVLLPDKVKTWMAGTSPAMTKRGERMIHTHTVASRLAAIFALLVATLASASAQSPAFRIDPFWPKPLPNNWILGQVGGMAVDAQDNIWVFQRPRSLTDDEKGATTGEFHRVHVGKFDSARQFLYRRGRYR